jgi:hypothetical protein
MVTKSPFCCSGGSLGPAFSELCLLTVSKHLLHIWLNLDFSYVILQVNRTCLRLPPILILVDALSKRWFPPSPTNRASDPSSGALPPTRHERQRPPSHATRAAVTSSPMTRAAAPSLPRAMSSSALPPTRPERWHPPPMWPEWRRPPSPYEVEWRHPPSTTPRKRRWTCPAPQIGSHQSAHPRCAAVKMLAKSMLPLLLCLGW